ncbi:MAG: MFS transporter [Bacteroidales bacterium]|nr:MFS transporter [Bacteroidales bacterium]
MKVSSQHTGTSLSILLYLSLAHLFNDAFQSAVSAAYPVIRDHLSLTFGQIGLIVFVYQICASVFQPVAGIIFDKYPKPWYLGAGTTSTMIGLTLLAFASSIHWVMLSVAFIGLGSSVIHPEASRLTHYASGGRHGLAQSIFQVGGNLGGAIGPLLAAAIVTPYGQRYIVVLAGIAVISLFTKAPVVRWYGNRIRSARTGELPKAVIHRVRLSKKKIYFSLFVLLTLMFSKHAYSASLSSFYTFYLIEKFGLTNRESQIFLFAYLLASAAGTFLGGPIGDKFGRKWVIWFSILGTAPFSLMMPYANLMWTCILSIMIGIILSSAFSAILVYAQELLPTKVGLISGLFFGLAFGIAGIAAAILGYVADMNGLEYVYKICAYIPLTGLAAVFLPHVKPLRK